MPMHIFFISLFVRVKCQRRAQTILMGEEVRIF